MPRTLAAALRRLVTAASRSRGESYFHDGRVSPLRSDATTFIAAVRGAHPYEVSLLLDGDRLLVDCTCPYFAGAREPCKHIWATILAADEARIFRVPPDIWLDVEDTEIDAPELDEDDELEEVGTLGTRARVARGADSPVRGVTSLGRTDDGLLEPRARRRDALVTSDRPAAPGTGTALADLPVASDARARGPCHASHADWRRAVPAGPGALGHRRWPADRTDDARAEEVWRLGKAEAADSQSQRHRAPARRRRSTDPRCRRRRLARLRILRPGLERIPRVAGALRVRAQPHAPTRSRAETVRHRPVDDADAIGVASVQGPTPCSPPSSGIRCRPNSTCE